MFWPWEVVERDHEIQDPIDPEKLRLLGEYVRLGPQSRVLDAGCGKGGPALVLASTFGCRVLGVELREAFASEARGRAAEAGLDALVEVRTGDAAELELEEEAFDAALCLGASFAWGTIADAAVALRRAVRPGGFVAVGEPFWRRLPLPDGIDAGGFVDLGGTAARLAGAGLALTGLIAASDDDWDRYESLHWRAVEEWLAANRGHERAAEFRAAHERSRAEYLEWRRELLGWAIFVGRRGLAQEYGQPHRSVRVALLTGARRRGRIGS